MKRVTFIIDAADFEEDDDLRIWLEQRLPIEEISITDAAVNPRAAVLEEAARAMCVHCKNGVAVEPHKGDFKHFVNDGLQARGEKGRWIGCFAAAIRKLGGKQ